MNIQSTWRGYWFKDAPYFDVACLRILIVGLQCFLLLSKVFDEMVYAIGLDESLYSPLPLFRMFMLPLGGERPDGDWMMGAFWLTMAFGALAFVGLMTNISLMLFALGNLLVQSYNYSFGDFHHPEAVMMIALLAFALSPCGKVLSVDSILRGWRAAGTSPAVSLVDYAGPHAGWPIKFIMWFFPLMYLSAIVGKLGRDGLDWVNGYTLQYYLVHDSLRKGGLPLAEWLSPHHDPILLAQIVVVLFQATFFLVIPFPKLRWIYLPIGLAFHFSNYWILKADFPQWIALYAVFIPFAAVVKSLTTANVVSDRTDVRRSYQ